MLYDLLFPTTDLTTMYIPVHASITTPPAIPTTYISYQPCPDLLATQDLISGIHMAAAMAVPPHIPLTVARLFAGSISTMYIIWMSNE